MKVAAVNRPQIPVSSSATGLGGATALPALGDLSDVSVPAPVTGDHLRFDGTNWLNSALKWIPVTVFDPTTGNYLPAVDGSGNQIMVEA